MSKAVCVDEKYLLGLRADRPRIGNKYYVDDEVGDDDDDDAEDDDDDDEDDEDADDVDVDEKYGGGGEGGGDGEEGGETQKTLQSPLPHHPLTSYAAVHRSQIGCIYLQIVSDARQSCIVSCLQLVANRCK